MIPQWLKQGNPEPSTSEGMPRDGRKSFLEKTIHGSASFLEETVLTDSYAGLGGLLQRLEPRCKMIAILILIVGVSLLRSPWLVWGIYLFTLILAAASKIEISFFLKRVWLFVPIFALLIILPALLNVVTPGTDLWLIARLHSPHDFGPYHIPAEITVTFEGVRSAILFVGRVAASVSLAVLLTLTTSWNRLFMALRGLKVPALFVLIVAMAYRYIFLLVGIVTDMHMARKSRTLRYLSTGGEQRWVAGRIGYLFRKSFQMSQNVHDAMLSRGFTGEFTSLALPRPRASDYFVCLLSFLFCCAMIGADHLMARW
ncbi:MAG TPA: cobalt ECF transporter T component CbiQ [Geobacteraceae bacterium]|nr:cobalt ECF transporter T component CbiQ [Geobacteraceae bacterium]